MTVKECKRLKYETKQFNRACERTITKLKIVLYVITIVCVICCIIAMSGFVHPTFDTKDMMHQIAELARAAGLPEDDPIIVRATQLWWEADEGFCTDRDIIATVTFNEAGYGCTERHMELVAGTVWNRKNHDAFPDTVYDVVCQKGQYLPAYADPNSYYSKRARQDPEVWAKCQEIAAKALHGQVDIPENVVFQANFPQGHGTYETHYTSYSTTYFCYY